MPLPPRYEVFSGDRLVLTVSDEPGVLVSALAPPPPPDRPLPRHPFLSAVAHAPQLEGELRRLLDASSSTAEFLERLRNAGYRVELAA
jgi:hypothetical protein